MAGACPAASELMLMTRAEMYGGRVIVNYSMAWGIMYYIAETGDYNKVLVAYFKALQKGMDLNEAYASTFGKLDMAKFDREWRAFIKSAGAAPKK